MEKGIISYLWKHDDRARGISSFSKALGLTASCLRRCRVLPICFVLPLPAVADNCLLRMLEEGAIIVPRHHTGVRLAEAGGSCTVYLNYELSDDGLPRNIETYTEVPACAHFSNAAAKALMKSRFIEGVHETDCRHEYTVELEP